MRLGADPEQLRELSAALRAAARTLDQLGPGTERRIRAAGWHGPDALRFDGTWRRCRRDLDDAAGRCREMSARIERQVDEQLTASQAHSDTRPDTRSAAPLPAFAPAETRYVGGIDVRLGPVVATLAGDLGIADLAGDTTRVTLAESIGAGGAVSAGSGLAFSIADEVSSPVAASSGTADGRLRAGGVRRRTWDVPDDRVDDLVVALAAERAGSTAPTTVSAARGAGDVIDGLVRRVTGVDPGLGDRVDELVSPPPPERTETLVEVEAAAAGAIATAGGWFGASGAASSTVRVGTAQVGTAQIGTAQVGTAQIGTARTTTIAEWSATSHGALTSAVVRRFGINLPDPLRMTANVRLELGDAPDGSRQLDVRISGIDDERLDEVAARIEFTDPAGGAMAHDVLQRLGRGDLAGALASLTDAEVQLEHVEVIASRGEIDGRSARAGGSAGAGPGIGFTLRGQRIDIERGPTIGG